jgi:hypothetical protein
VASPVRVRVSPSANCLRAGHAPRREQPLKPDASDQRAESIGR